MGMCSGKCTHYYSPHERHLITCCGQKIKLIQGLGGGDKGDTAKLLAFDSDVSSDDKHVIISGRDAESDVLSVDKHVIRCWDAKSEAEVFGYSVISQESDRSRDRGSRKLSTPKTADRNNFAIAAAAGDIIMRTSFPDNTTFDTGNGDKLAFLPPLEPVPTELSMYIVTWNMNGKALVRSIAKLLDVEGERHDLYVIGLQEAHNSVAESIISEALGEKYSFVSAASMQSLQLFIIARKAILPFLSRPLVDKISTGGLGGLAGRQKGAVAVTFRFKEASLLFVACHFAPHESNVMERNAQYHRISQAVFNKQVPVVGLPGGVFSGCSYKNGLIVDDSILGGTTTEPHHEPHSNSRFVEKADVVVWMGDLNYRVEMNRNSVAFLIKHKLEEALWSKDQLTRALRRGQAFAGYKEGPLSFRPTYKYDVGTDNYDTSSKERVPSWTDRILYKVGDAGRLKVQLKSYNSINSIRSSDHRPVKALMKLTLNNNKLEKVK
ncbi:unnamed protein product [Calypogeia fissa]